MENVPLSLSSFAIKKAKASSTDNIVQPQPQHFLVLIIVLFLMFHCVTEVFYLKWLLIKMFCNFRYTSAETSRLLEGYFFLLLKNKSQKVENSSPLLETMLDGGGKPTLYYLESYFNFANCILFLVRSSISLFVENNLFTYFTFLCVRRLPQTNWKFSPIFVHMKTKSSSKIFRNKHL